MKNILYILVLLISSVIYSQVGITTDTNFSGRHCRGTNGLCSTDENKSVSSSNTVIGYDDETVTFTIDRNRIGTTEEIQIIGRPIETSDIDTTLTFIMEDDFTLNTTVVTYLQIPSQMVVITEGSYPVYVSEEHLLITFKL
jgi:hypothetical protein